MRLKPELTEVVTVDHLSEMHSAELLIVLGQEVAKNLKLMESESGKVLVDQRVQTPFLITYHPRQLLSEPPLKRQAWAELQVAMAHLKL
jgi:uracil-DNA glycosylase